MAHILLLEPDTRLAKVYISEMNRNRHTVMHCKEASEAIAALDSTRIDLVILEIQIALHNGIEFLYEMRSYPEWQSIPVIINTLIPSIVIEKNKLLTKQLRISEVLYKPATKLSTLNSVIQRNVVAQLSL